MQLGVVGCSGRMGRMLVQQIHETAGTRLVAVSERADSAVVGTDIGLLAVGEALGVPISGDAGAVFETAEAVIDFTVPEATVLHARQAAARGRALVIGTTGLAPEHQAEIAKAARQVPIVQAANMSLGVNLLLGLVRQVAAALDPAFDIEIVEMHHRHKVDAPSGTALALGRAAADGRKVDLESVADRVRDGHTGPRGPGRIGFATLRGGDVVGEHTVIFAGSGERIELTHKAAGRHIFAAGAVKAALWTKDKGPGLYSMQDVLGLSA